MLPELHLDHIGSTECKALTDRQHLSPRQVPAFRCQCGEAVHASGLDLLLQALGSALLPLSYVPDHEDVIGLLHKVELVRHTPDQRRLM